MTAQIGTREAALLLLLLLLLVQSCSAPRCAAALVVVLEVGRVCVMIVGKRTLCGPDW